MFCVYLGLAPAPSGLRRFRRTEKGRLPGLRVGSGRDAEAEGHGMQAVGSLSRTDLAVANVCPPVAKYSYEILQI